MNTQELVLKDIEETKKILYPNILEMQHNLQYGASEPYLEYDCLYSFATENCSVPIFRKKGDFHTVLVSLGSGDQPINCIARGAKKVDVFDVNRLTEYGFALKCAALKVIPEQILEFYSTFDSSLYSQFSKELSQKHKLYWDAIFNENLENDVIYRLFGFSELSIGQIINTNYYLQPDVLKRIGKEIDQAEIHFMPSSLYDLPIYIQGKEYDFMYLSNIFDFLCLSENEEDIFKDVDTFLQFLQKELIPHLKENGVLIPAYLYGFDSTMQTFFESRYLQGRKIQPYPQCEDSHLNFIKSPETVWGYNYTSLAYYCLFQSLKKEDTQFLYVPRYGRYVSTIGEYDAIPMVKKRVRN